MRALLDTNVVVRHLTGDPSDEARRATAFLAGAHQLLATDVMFAELVFVLSSFYERPREEIAASARALLAHPSIVTVDEELLRRALELYELSNLHFVDAYVAAAAELTGVEAVASFDRGLDWIPGITRVEP